MSQVPVQTSRLRAIVKTLQFCFTGVAVLITGLGHPAFSADRAGGRDPASTTASLSSERLQNVEQLIRQAETAESNQRYAEAERAWQQIIQRQPNATWAKYRLGFALRIQNKNEPAIALYRQITQQAPKEATAYLELGKTLLTQSWGQSAAIAQAKLRQALPAYRRAIELQPDGVETLEWWANLPPEAIISVVRQDVQARPQKTGIDSLLLWSAFRNSRKSLEALGSVRQNFPEFCQKNPEFCPNQGRSDPKRELEALQQAIQQDPKRAIAYEMLGLSQFELRQYAQAAASFKQAIALNSQRAKPYYRLGETLMAQNQVNDGIRVFYNAAQIEPDTTAMDSGFWWFSSQQPKDQIVTALKTLLENRPHPMAYYILGNLYTSALLTSQEPSKYLSAAGIAFETSVKLDPNFAKAYKRLGDVLADQKKFKEAEMALRKAIQLNPRLAAYTRLRFVLRAQGKFDDAFQVSLAEQAVTK